MTYLLRRSAEARLALKTPTRTTFVGRRLLLSGIPLDAALAVQRCSVNVNY